MPSVREVPKIRIVAPSNSMATLPEDHCSTGIARLEAMGFQVELGKHVHQMIMHRVGAVEHRLADLHDAADDPDVDVVLAAQGGANSNQLLPHIDYERMRASNKLFVGFSDVSGLLLALGKQGASVVHGPMFADLCNPILPDYTVKGLLACIARRRVAYQPPNMMADDVWACDQQGSEAIRHRPFAGWTVVRPGRATGPLVGGNLVTIGALAGTPHFPDTRGCIFFIEDAIGAAPSAVHRDLTHFAQLGAFDEPAALMIGKMPRHARLGSGRAMKAILEDVMPRNSEYPVVLDVAFSHLSPMMSLPMFRRAELVLTGESRLVVDCDRAGETVEVSSEEASSSV